LETKPQPERISLAQCDRHGGVGTRPRPRHAETSPTTSVTLPIPDKTVVLTFDDAVKSHRTFVAPLLKEAGFRATFFVCHRWMDDAKNFMTWQEIADLHQMGFEIGNHSWTHADFSSPRSARAFTR
jgi:peptidoglycan/xylan/chitin deacetylase (PgdA/CDA1 family)